jgi:hypothetical protein
MSCSPISRLDSHLGNLFASPDHPEVHLDTCVQTLIFLTRYILVVLHHRTQEGRLLSPAMGIGQTTLRKHASENSYLHRTETSLFSHNPRIGTLQSSPRMFTKTKPGTTLIDLRVEETFSGLIRCNGQ